VLANKLLFFLLCFYFCLVKPNKYGRIRLQLNPKPKFEKRRFVLLQYFILCRLSEINYVELAYSISSLTA